MSEKNESANLKSIIAVLFIISGATGLIYQVVWFKYLGIFLGNTVGFGLVAIGGVLRQLSGAVAIGWLFVLINVLFAVSFLMVGRMNMSENAM